jgi:hypothetical protein
LSGVLSDDDAAFLLDLSSPEFAVETEAVLGEDGEIYVFYAEPEGADHGEDTLYRFAWPLP